MPPSAQRIAKPDPKERPAVALDVPALAGVLDRARTESGQPLVGLVEASPVLLVFLRHAGCTFCREALGDIAATRQEIEAGGARIVLVHMGDRSEMQRVIAHYGLSDVERICDPEQRLYDAFGLVKGNWRQLYGPKIWLRGMIAGLMRGHGISMPVADATQMPGVFYIEKGWVVRRFRHKSAADRPCYADLCADILPKADQPSDNSTGHVSDHPS